MKFAHLSPYNYAGNKPITQRDIEGLQGENEASSPQGGNPTAGEGSSGTNEIFDSTKVHLVSSSSGKYLGSTEATEDVKPGFYSIGDKAFSDLSENDFKAINAGTGFETSLSEDAKNLTINTEKIHSDMRSIMTPESDAEYGNFEKSMFIIFDKAANEITSIVNPNTDSEGRHNTEERSFLDFGRGIDKSTVSGESDKIILAQIHSHPEPSKLNKNPGAGMSQEDVLAAVDINVPIYAIGTFSSQPGGNGDIYGVIAGQKESETTDPISNVKDVFSGKFNLVHHAIQFRR